MFREGPPAVSIGSSSSSPESPTDLRRYARVPIEVRATYAVGGEPENRSGVISDIGAGGVLLETDEDLMVGVTLALTFPLDGAALSATGRVVLSYFDGGKKRFRHGIAFTAIDPGQQVIIATYVAANKGV